MKVYLVFDNGVMLYACQHRDYAEYLRDWCAADYEHGYRCVAAPYIKQLDRVQRSCNDRFYVFEEEVLIEQI